MTGKSTEIEVERWLEHPGAAPACRGVRLRAGAGGTEVIGPAAVGHGRLALPAPVNAHDHGMGVRCLDFGSYDDALEPWIAGLRLRPPTDPYLEALVAFGRVALSGCGATMHCHNSLNAARLVEEAAAVVRAARDCGIRLALSCPLLDTSPWVYGGPEALWPGLTAGERAQLEPLVPHYRSIAEQLEAVDEIARTHPEISVQYGPIGPQWASDALLEAVAEASEGTGRRIHMHLLESPRQRAWLDQRFPEGIVAHLDRIGFLSPRLAVAHGVQLSPSECEVLADRGVTLVSNPSANLRLRSGVAPVEDARRAALKLALGLDGTGFDDDQDIWRELRLFRLLHAGHGMQPRIGAAELFGMAIGQGAAVTGTPPAADLTVIDFGALTADALFDDLDETELILGRMSARYVTGLVVAGREVVRNGRLTGVDLDAARLELAAQARADQPRLQAERRTAALLAGVIRRHYAKTE